MSHGDGLEVAEIEKKGGQQQSARAARKKVVICSEVETERLGLWWIEEGPRCDFCPNPARQ